MQLGCVATVGQRPVEHMSESVNRQIAPCSSNLRALLCIPSPEAAEPDAAPKCFMVANWPGARLTIRTAGTPAMWMARVCGVVDRLPGSAVLAKEPTWHSSMRYL